MASRKKAGNESAFDRRAAALEAENARLHAVVASQDEALGQLKALAAREAQIRVVADSLPVLISYVDADRCYRFNNKAYENWFGHRRRDLYGRHLRDVLGDAAYEELKTDIDAALAGERVSADRQLAYRDGGERSVHIEYVPDRGEDGIVGFFALVQDISERQRIEQDLRESEARFRSMADSAAAPVWVTGEGGIEFVNQAMVEFAGRPPDQLLGNVWMDLVHSDDIEAVLAKRTAAWAVQEPYSFEARFRRADGEWRWLRATCNPRRDGSGAFKGYVGVAVDLTEPRRAEAELRDESRILETLNRTGAALAAELDLERVVQMVTDAGVELSGAAFGAFFYNVIDDLGGSYMLYTVSGVDRGLFDKLPMPRKTAVFAPTFDGEGVVRSDDITQDPRYGKSETHHGMPKEHLPVRSYLAVPVVSRSGEVIGGLFFGHPEPARFTERHERLLVGIAGQAAVAIDNARLFEAAQRELAERRRAEAALLDLNQTLEVRVADAIAERERAEDALRQSQKMEAVGQLTGGIAHDFNNLLTVIAGNLDAAQRRLGGDVDPRVLRSLGSALVGAERAATLTQRLLAFSRRQPLNPKPVDANALVTGMSELLHRTLGETIRIETVLSPGLRQIEVDPHQLENALLNIAVNARDAMPDGGNLTIETSNVAPGNVPELFELERGAYVLIRMTDTGTGMSADMVVRACEPFFTTKEVGKGTGLGLSMVYGFVKQSGGHVEIESQPGQGTMVSLYLPRLEGEAQTEDRRARASLLPCGRNETLLVCEDDADVRAYTVEALRDLGYRVLEAGDGPEALAWLSTEGAVDLLFTDVVLPGGMTGAELARRAQALCPRLKILFTTGYARDAIVHEGRLDPGIELIAKPFTSADLAERIREVLDTDAPIRPDP